MLTDFPADGHVPVSSGPGAGSDKFGIPTESSSDEEVDAELPKHCYSATQQLSVGECTPPAASPRQRRGGLSRRISGTVQVTRQRRAPETFRLSTFK